jgi:UDP-N-acetylglucosamine 2-epimerase (non-hydrolysing)
MVQLLTQADLVLTDSGGIQEEAPSLNKPVLILRDITERQEVVTLGAARLVGTNITRIVDETIQLLEDRQIYLQMAAVPNPYGDGHASRRIVEALLRA